EINREKDVEKVVDQDVDKHEDVEKESEFGNDELENDELGSVNTECENHNDLGNKEVEKNTEDLIKGTVVYCETLKESDFPSTGLEDIESLKEKPIDELKWKSVDFKGGHPTVKRQQIKKAMEGEKNVPKTRGKKTDADKQGIKKPQVRKQTAAQLSKSKETKARTVKPAPTKRRKKEPNDKEETAIYASPISFIPPPIDTESEKR
ncbi:hypothetical protein Tco_0872775, partial [Tanacetum coccineum]